MQKHSAIYEDETTKTPIAFEVELSAVRSDGAIFVRESLQNQGQPLTAAMLEQIAGSLYERKEIFSGNNHPTFLYHYNQKAGVWDEYALWQPTPQHNAPVIDYLQKLPQCELEARYDVAFARTEGERRAQQKKDALFIDYQQREYYGQLQTVLAKAPEWANEIYPPFSVEEPGQLMRRYERYKRDLAHIAQQEREAAKQEAKIETGSGKIESTNGDLLTFKFTVWNDQTLFLRQIADGIAVEHLCHMPEEMAAAVGEIVVPDKRLNGRGVKDGRYYVYDPSTQMWDEYKFEVGVFGKIQFQYVEQRYQHDLEAQHKLTLTQTEEQPQQTRYSEQNLKRELWRARMTLAFSQNTEKRELAQKQAESLSWQLHANKEIKKQFEKFEPVQEAEQPRTLRR